MAGEQSDQSVDTFTEQLLWLNEEPLGMIAWLARLLLWCVLFPVLIPCNYYAKQHSESSSPIGGKKAAEQVPLAPWSPQSTTQQNQLTSSTPMPAGSSLNLSTCQEDAVELTELDISNIYAGAPSGNQSTG